MQNLKIIFLLTVFTIVLSSFALVFAYGDDVKITGGWGTDCNTGGIACAGGRVIGCGANPPAGYQSECAVSTGNQTWVRCRVYDAKLQLVAESADRCP